MNETAKKVGSPGLPQVNLLPREFAEKRQMRAVQFTALFAVLIAIALIVAGYVLALGAKQMAQNDLEDTRREQTLALEDRDSKVSVYSEYVLREQQEYALAQVAVGEMDYEQLAAAVLATHNNETSFDSITINGPSALGMGSTQEGFYGGGVGALNFVARAESYADATALIARLEEVPGIAKVRGSIEQYSADGAVSFWQLEGEGLVTDLRLTGRLVPSDGITGVDAFSVAADSAAEEEPNTTPSPEPTPVPTEEAGEG
ncbi:hypothetical protein ACNI3K_11115 [Demequina sp. SO4-13]|uniref:hypothetical protein n=1 Tax=Demequina sp. SO4-13 TaxID=3401027 RepID=UPI003AF620D8